MANKNASVLYQVIIHLILIGLIFGLFFLASTSRVNSKLVKQQILEKELALAIDSAGSGAVLIIDKEHVSGRVSNLEIKEGRVFAYVDGQGFSKGYPYFTKYSISVEKKEDKYLIRII